MEKLKKILIVALILCLCSVLFNLTFGVILEIWNYESVVFYKIALSSFIVMLAFGLILCLTDTNA